MSATHILERLLTWLQRRELRRKVKWQDCVWNPQGFRKRLSDWTLKRVMFESSATHILAMSLQGLMHSGMSAAEVDEFWHAELRKIKQRADEMPWGQG